MPAAASNGYDIHRWWRSALILGGVRLDHRSARWPSDADVLVHALIDALLGASARRIGLHSPETALEGPTACCCLEQVSRLVRQPRAGRCSMWTRWWWRSVPKLKPTRKRCGPPSAARLGVALTWWGVKATTTKGLGPTGSPGRASLAMPSPFCSNHEQGPGDRASKRRCSWCVCWSGLGLAVYTVWGLAGPSRSVRAGRCE